MSSINIRLENLGTRDNRLRIAADAASVVVDRLFEHPPAIRSRVFGPRAKTVAPLRLHQAAYPRRIKNDAAQKTGKEKEGFMKTYHHKTVRFQRENLIDACNTNWIGSMQESLENLGRRQQVDRRIDLHI